MGIFWNGKCTSKVRLEGKTAIVTGCNTGIGKYTVLDLYCRGARVLMACRDVSKAESAREWVLQQSQGKLGIGELCIYQLDLASLSSVRQCAQMILDEENYIHILINNAAVFMCPYSKTEDGYEIQFATNHLGHFLFTMILLPKIISSAPARIVNVTSSSHKLITASSMYFEDINMEHGLWYSSWRAYCRSKLAQVLFTRELAARLKGTKVTVYSVHPGFVDTEIGKYASSSMFPGASFLYTSMGKLMAKSPESGAQTTLHCALEERLANETGLYYDDCEEAGMSSTAMDVGLAKKLWDVSLDMVKFYPPPPFGRSY